MKKLLLVIAVSGFFMWSMTSCGGKNEKTKEGDDNQYEIPDADKKPKEASPEDLIKQGQTLVDANDCKTCHHPTNKLIGPAHTDVAKI